MIIVLLLIGYLQSDRNEFLTLLVPLDYGFCGSLGGGRVESLVTESSTGCDFLARNDTTRVNC